ncbi:hypothetical protein ASD51_31470 [Streptomyces sp. Root55]|nr:hypothetical protein ASD51_31470 [Streptomyces sp. Root55]
MGEAGDVQEEPVQRPADQLHVVASGHGVGVRIIVASSVDPSAQLVHARQRATHLSAVPFDRVKSP